MKKTNLKKGSNTRPAGAGARAGAGAGAGAEDERSSISSSSIEELNKKCASGEVSPKTSPESFYCVYDKQSDEPIINPHLVISETSRLVNQVLPEAHNKKIDSSKSDRGSDNLENMAYINAESLFKLSALSREVLFLADIVQGKATSRPRAKYSVDNSSLEQALSEMEKKQEEYTKELAALEMEKEQLDQNFESIIEEKTRKICDEAKEDFVRKTKKDVFDILMLENKFKLLDEEIEKLTAEIESTAEKISVAKGQEVVKKLSLQRALFLKRVASYQVAHSFLNITPNISLYEKIIKYTFLIPSLRNAADYRLGVYKQQNNDLPGALEHFQNIGDKQSIYPDLSTRIDLLSKHLNIVFASNDSLLERSMREDKNSSLARILLRALTLDELYFMLNSQNKRKVARAKLFIRYQMQLIQQYIKRFDWDNMEESINKLSHALRPSPQDTKSVVELKDCFHQIESMVLATLFEEPTNTSIDYLLPRYLFVHSNFFKYQLSALGRSDYIKFMSERSRENPPKALSVELSSEKMHSLLTLFLQSLVEKRDVYPEEACIANFILIELKDDTDRKKITSLNANHAHLEVGPTFLKAWNYYLLGKLIQHKGPSLNMPIAFAKSAFEQAITIDHSLIEAIEALNRLCLTDPRIPVENKVTGHRYGFWPITSLTSASLPAGQNTAEATNLSSGVV